MKQVSDLMTYGAKTCRMDDSMSHAARLMWENDCGALPVIDGNQKVVGMITDRDICMAAYTQGLPLSEIRVGTGASSEVVAIREEDPLDTVESLMGRHQIRRVPVVDKAGSIVGILSMNDIARAADGKGRRGGLGSDSIIATLKSICRPNSDDELTPSH